MHRKVAGAVAAALALGVASCGGDEPLTKAEFVKEVNAICKGPRQKRTTTGRGPESFFAQILARQREVVQGLAEVKPPVELESGYRALKQAQANRLDLIERAIAAARKDPKNGIGEELNNEGQRVQRQVARAAADLGAKSCT